MKFSTIIKHATELNRIILKSPNPADSVAGEYLRAKKYIGSNERKIISEIVFNKLRMESLAIDSVHKFSDIYNVVINEQNIELAAMCAAIYINDKLSDSVRKFLLTRLAKFTETADTLDDTLKLAIVELDILGNNVDQFATFCSDYAENFLIDAKSDSLLSREKLCMSDTMLASLQKIYDSKTINQLALCSLHSAPVCLRVNTLKISRDKVLQILQDNDISAVASEISPDGIILLGRPNLSFLDIFKNGDIEVQDVGSQLIGYSLAPDENSKILDACAGAGGKTLHLAVITHDRADILATDIEFKRLKEIAKRTDKAGISSVRTIIQKKMNLKEQVKEKFDFILIDAPCSGTGTIRRMPMAKWRLNDKLLGKINNMQAEILEYYSDFLLPGGSLVYATCSLLPNENAEIIDAFLAKHPEFKPEPILPALELFGVNIEHLNIKPDDYKLYLTPLNGETDGFFMSKITLSDER